MSHKTHNRPSPAAARVIGLIFIVVMLAAGLLLGMQSTLKLTRDASGAVTAVNSWRFADRVNLLTRTVTHLQKVTMKEMDLSESDKRSSAYRDVFGMITIPDQVVLIGDGEVRYPYREDFWLIDGFLKNKSNNEAVFVHPADIRRVAASCVLLVFGVLSLGGWIVRLFIGRDPLEHAPDNVKPAPPKVGAAIFGAVVLALWWFFATGHEHFGPLATSKVKLLMESATQDDAAGIERAVKSGVFVDARDDQAVTALMKAARAGSAKATDALLKAGANPSLRDHDDRTALLHAIEGKNSSVASKLIDVGVDLGASDVNGRNALHHAAENGDAALLRKLLQAGGDVNKPDAQGWTALIFAAAYGGQDSVKTLLDAGADAEKRTNDGRLAADLATRDLAVHDLLLKAALK